MKYCYIGTETIIHCSNKETSSIFFSLSDGSLSLLSDTEKLFFFLLLSVQTYAEEVQSRYMFVFLQTCIVDLVSGHGPIGVIDKTERVSLYARACLFTIKKKYSFNFKIFYFQTNTTKKNHLQFLFYTFDTILNPWNTRMIRRQ